MLTYSNKFPSTCHYHAHKSRPLNPVTVVYTFQSCLFTILPIGFLTNIPHMFLIYCACYMSYPSQIHFTTLSLRPLSTLFSNTPSLCSSLDALVSELYVVQQTFHRTEKGLFNFHFQNQHILGSHQLLICQNCTDVMTF